MHPYLILGIPLAADDAAIRAAWQRAVQENPPERDALRFQQVQEAYQSIKDARARAAWQVHPRPAPADSPEAALRRFIAWKKFPAVPGAPAFRSFLQACTQPPDK